MPIRPKIQQTPSRTTLSFTQGGGPKMAPLTTRSTGPSLSGNQATPPRIATLGVDSQSRQVSVPALAPGAQTTLTVTIPLPNLPALTSTQGRLTTPTSNLVTRVSDRVVFKPSMTVQHAIAGLAVSSFTAKPQGRSGAQTFTGPTLPGGQNYSTFSVVCRVVVVATAATPPGVLTITANGDLTLQPGGVT